MLSEKTLRVDIDTTFIVYYVGVQIATGEHIDDTIKITFEDKIVKGYNINKIVEINSNKLNTTIIKSIVLKELK